MENLPQSVLGIIARWSSRVLLVIFFTFPLAISAQENDRLSGNELRKFNEMFFEAEKLKNIGELPQALELYEKLYDMDQDNATICYELAMIHSDQDNSTDAIYYGERSVDLDEDNKWFKHALAAIYRKFGKQEEEIKILSELVEMFPENTDYRFELAVAYLSSGKFEESIKELDALEELVGVNELLSEQKQKIYLEMGDVEGAAGEIRKLIQVYPKELDFYGILARLYKANGYEEKAFELYNQMLKIAPDDPRPHLDLAEYYRGKGEVKQSITHLEKAVGNPDMSIDQKVPVLLSLFNASESDTTLKEPTNNMLRQVVEAHSDDAKAHAIYGDYLSREGYNVEALKAYKKAVSLEGGNKFQIWEQILLIEIQTEMYDSLIVDGPMAVELFPNHPLPYFFSGVAYLMKQQTEDAIYYLSDGLNYVIGNPVLKEQFHLQLADAYNRNGEHKKSDEQFEKLLKINPNSSTALNNYAYYLSVRGENLDKALKMTELSNSLEPNNAVFLDTYAWVLYKKGDYTAALEKIEQAINLSKGSLGGEVLEHYGDILLKNGKEQEALQQYQKAKNHEDASSEIDEKINSLSSP